MSKLRVKFSACLVLSSYLTILRPEYKNNFDILPLNIEDLK
jgi:hypothetical protein